MLRNFDDGPDLFDFRSSSAEDVKADSAVPQPKTITISDAHFLFTAHFERQGQDLLLTDDHGRKVIVDGYFRGDKHPTLLSPQGAALSGELVDALAGHAQYAQAAAPGAGQFIGRVEKAGGVVTVIRNGVSVALNVGDSVYKGDVVQTGSGSTCGISFTDGSALNVTANARMVLSEYVYDPNGSGNSELFNLVQGTVTFVSGQVAKTGTMNVTTPTATMGIRGTVGTIQIAAQDGTITVDIHDQGDGINHVADIIVAGQVIGQATTAGGRWTITPSGPLQALAQEIARTPEQIQQGFVNTQQALDTQAKGGPIYIGPQQQPDQGPQQPNRTDAQPGSQTASGSGTSPDLLKNGITLLSVTQSSGPLSQSTTTAKIGFDALQSDGTPFIVFFAPADHIPEVVIPPGAFV